MEASSRQEPDDIDTVRPVGEAEYDGGTWGGYRFGAWLEEEKAAFILSFPYWRNGRFAGQYTLRAEPYIIRMLVDEMKARGWLDKPGWADL